MTVIQLMAGGAHGGAETFFTDLVIALHRQGLAQLVVTRPHAERLARLAEAGVAVETAPFRRWIDFTTGPLLRRLARAHPQAVWHAWMGRAAAAVPAGASRVIGWHGGYYDLKRFGRCGWQVGVTEGIARHLVEAGAPAQRVRCIHTFAGIDSLPAQPRAALGTPQTAPLVLCLARMHPKKGIETLLEALARLPEVHAWLAGDGPDLARYRALAARLELEGRVRFLGWREDRGALLRAADVLAVPSRYEPFGTVMVEAWMTGTPLVAAAAAGPAAYVRDGENGLLVPIDDAAGLAAALRRALGDGALRERLIAGGRATWQEGFSVERVTARWMALYREAASA